MNTAAISVKNMSKKYQLYKSPKCRLKEALHPFRRKYHNEFWALKDVSFEIRQGETVGIIGQNGSGKSTLLQIITGTMMPTSGEVKVNGRVSALLELGAGFNPEFTGTDNVYLNGSIMGLSRETIEERFEDIASFADIGDFIDQPVKTYSSGMYVRLAFACAINVDPDILIIDEALSVGDAKFQNKCFQKFNSFRENGKTILFVSHSTDAIVNHCNHAILLDKGSIIKRGKPKDAVNRYLELISMGELVESPPRLAEDGYKGYNILHYKNQYYALAQSLGYIDLADLVMEKDKLNEFLKTEKCYIADSLRTIRGLVDPDSFRKNSVTPIVKAEKTELDRFLEETPTEDRCIYRNSYNKNGHRYGDKRGEIVDYLIVCKDKYDPVTVYSGDVIDIYLKTRFYQHIESPEFGLAIKTVDGVLVYGTSTAYAKISTRHVRKSEIVVLRLSIKMDVHSGDYFIDLGAFEEINEAHKIFDRRCAIIHLNVLQRNRFDGFVELETFLQVV